MDNSTTSYGRLKCVAKVSGVFNLILLPVVITLIVIQLVLDKEQSSQTSLPSSAGQLSYSGELCLPCDLRGNVITDTLYERIFITSRNTTLCCFRHDAELQKLIYQLETENDYYHHGDNLHETHETLSWWKERNFAAHLYAVHDTVLNRPPAWTDRYHRTSFCRNLTMRNERIKVPAKGIGTYFVYSLFTFDFSNVTQLDNRPVGNHTIYIYKQMYVEEENKKKPLWTSRVVGLKRPSKQTSFLCGIVMLDKEEEISPEAVAYINHEKSVKHIDKSLFANYFGMFKLD